MLTANPSERSYLRTVASFLFRCTALAGVLLAGSVVVRADDVPGGITEKPLPFRSRPAGKTMFVLMSPETTGIKTENNYADPEMKGKRYQEFETSSIGTGVAIGDYDGDGRPDIYVVSKTESCRLFLNLGDWKFEDVTEKAGIGDQGAAAGVWKQGATFVDVNNDGHLDLYVCRTAAPNLLYVNQGNGSFKEQAHDYGLDVNDSSVMAAFCDYDRDGWLDVYIATNILDLTAHPNGQRGYLFHNNRNGTFANVTEPGGITGDRQSHAAIWWDFDHDGWPDLYVAYDYGLPDSLYHNNRDGTFTEMASRVLPHTSFSSMGADLGDVNNDGLIDFLVADMAATTHQVDQHSIADARSRAEVRHDSDTSVPMYHRNALLLNTGTGKMLEAAVLAGVDATDWTWSVRFEDLDNDGRLDLHVTNGFIHDPGVDVLKRMMTAQTPAERIKIMYESGEQAEVNLAFRNLGDLQFSDMSKAWGLDQKGVSFGAAFGDLDGDGNLDLAYTNYHAGLTVLRNDNDTGHRVIIDLRGTISNRFGVGATVKIESGLGTQVRQLVLARGYLSSSEPMIHFGLGENTEIKRLTVTWPSGHVQVFENLGVDRRFTITEPGSGSEPVGAALRRDPNEPSRHKAAPTVDQASEFVEVGHSIGLARQSREETLDELAQQRLLPAKLNRRGPSLAVGNISGSDHDDVVVGGTTLTAVQIVAGSEEGTFAAADSTTLLPVGPVDDGPLLLFDADGDGHNDLLVTKGGNRFPVGAREYQPELYLGDARGGFKAAPEATLPGLTNNVGAVVAADFDHSGRLGLFLGGRVSTGQYPSVPRSALLANRGGKFEDVTDTLAPGLRSVGMVTAALWSDVDGDGWIDLLLALEWGRVTYYHNKQGQSFEDWTDQAGFAAAGTGWWTSLASADFNGDGRPDYIAGNVGLNTQYRADARHPAVLFSGDFTGGGGNQLIEGYYEGEKLYPWRSRRDLGAVIPSILKRIPKNDSYARATLMDILGADKLAKAQRFAATELRSGVFMSQPDGTYRFEPLPRLAQISPLQGTAAGDFDGDGHADIYAVQNSYAPIASVGRFDGGLSQLLRGDGHGHFTAVPPAESGLLVPGDAKSLVILDFNRDGWPDFLVSRNNDTALAFRNQPIAGRHSLRIQLRGTAGNPSAIGARITIELSDGSTQTSEVFAGSGYYSQSTAACFFGWLEGNSPKRIRVRWPAGFVSEQEYPSGVATLEVVAPK